MTSRCIARVTAQIKIKTDALSSSFLFTLYVSGPAKSTPGVWKSLLASVRNYGSGDVSVFPYGFVENTLHVWQSYIAFFTNDLKRGIHHSSRIAPMVLANATTVHECDE